MSKWNEDPYHWTRICGLSEKHFGAYTKGDRMEEDEAISRIICLISEKREAIEKLIKEISALDSIRLSGQKAQAKQHIFDNKEDLEKAMLRNHNPFDTFLCKAKK